MEPAVTPIAPMPSNTNFREGKWQKGQGKYSFISQKPIPAMNYIESTLNFLNKEIGKISIKGL